MKNIGQSQEADAITGAVLSMGHHLDLEVIAEGVETAEQEQFLRERGCDRLQGYLFSEPIAADAMEALLKARESNPSVPSVETES